MGSRDKLFEIADRQQGYFTPRQAIECGYHRSHFHRYLHSGEWIKEQRGIYRLAFYPVTERPELVMWSLWSQNRYGEAQGVWSHETALDIYEISDVMPSKMHMTVPKHFRKSTPIPKVIVLHYADLKPEDIRMQQGYRLTTPKKTLLDIATERRLSPEIIAQAVQDALQKGLVSKQELASLQELQQFLDTDEV